MSVLRLSVAASAAVLAVAGLPLVGASPAVAAVGPALAWDFNGDGRADLAVGAPGEDAGTTPDVGTVSVFMANSSGAFTTPSVVWTQDSPNVPGVAEAGDQFGYATTSGDYDGDGYADLAVAANKEDVGSGSTRKVDSGMVTVLWGSASGLTGIGSVSLDFNPGGVIYAGSFFGDALASGDMNADGLAELAIGAPGRENVRVYDGAAKGTFGTAWTTFGEATAGVAGTRHSGDLFGESLAMGDFNNDNKADLVVGAPYDSDDTGYSVGAIVVLPGGTLTNPVNFAASSKWGPETAGIQGVSHRFTLNDLPDSFGRTLAAGDFNSDGWDDIAVGIPGVPVARTSGGKLYEDAGSVQILFGSATGVSSADKLITQETDGIAGASETGDLFGASLAAGSAAGKNNLLAVGSAEELVRILKGGVATGSVALSQNSSGIVGVTEPGDAFGAFVRFFDNTGSGNETLAVSSPGEDASAGAVFLLPSTGSLPSGVGSVKLDESVDPLVSGTKESGDAWGWLGDSH